MKRRLHQKTSMKFRRLPGSPYDFQEVQRLKWKSSGRLPGSRLEDFLEVMMRQLHAVYGEWLLKDGCWNFVVDHFKGARMLFLSEGSTHADLVAMAQEDYNLDMNTESVELTYSLQQMAPDLPPIHVTSDRQVRNLLEITKTHEVRLCVSSFSKMRTVSAVRRRFSFRIFK
ncbi:hypothetical protein F2Q69_00043899 [Brassica cretica]|uniref:PB1 domain-containing protein n=1 Tax=Brassica cretica TaxID=69181 RepID=A0A8S9NBY0_BRACR|nr:hypothetical protein F2Q69_00043899 [Brassica cretica]